MNKELIYEIIMPNFPRVVRLSEHRRARYFKPTDKLAMKYLEKEKTEVIDLVTNGFGLDNKNKTHKLNSNFIWKAHKSSSKTNKKIEWRLYNTETKEYVIKNPSVAGTPNDEIINGQKMYNGEYNPFTRDKIMQAIHDYMIPFLKGLELISTFPLIIDGFMYDYGKECPISKGRLWDVGNRQFPYNKAFEDVLQKEGVIKQDDFEHIIGSPRLIFINLDKSDHINYINTLPDLINHFNDTNLGNPTRRLVYQIYKVC